MIPGNMPIINANCKNGFLNLKRKRESAYDMIVVIKVFATAHITAKIKVFKSQCA